MSGRDRYVFADEILKIPGLEGAGEMFRDHLEVSAACFPGELPRFLRPEQISQTRALAHLPAEADGELHEAARRIAASPGLLYLIWHCHRLLFEHLEYEAVRISGWPFLTEALGELAGAFYLLVALDAIPRIRAVHAEFGIPEQVCRDTRRYYYEPVRLYGEQHEGHFGVLPRSLYWWRHYTRGDLYRLGRLEYMVKPFCGCLRAYRRRQTNEVIALAEEGTRFDAEGLCARPDTDVARVARFVERNGSVVGLPIDPRGWAVEREVELSLEEWKPVLASGDPVLEVHIPFGGGMTPDRCRESMQRALAFFPRYFPERRFVGFACGSWILNPHLGRIYRPDSNMVLWQRELYLFPVPSGDRAGVHFIFGREDVDFASAPRDTSLRRALLDHMVAGGRLIAGGMFMLSGDFAQFGSQVYREGWRQCVGEREGGGNAG